MDHRSEYAVFVETNQGKTSLQSMLDGRMFASVTTVWSLFADDLARVRAAAAYVPDLDGQYASKLKRLRLDRPFTPLALVTELSPSNLKSLNTLPEFDELLLIAETDKLPDVLRRIAGRTVLLEAAALIENLEDYPANLRLTLARACRRAEPVRTVAKLASDVLGSNRQTLWKLWRSSAPAETHPHDFIDWLLVAHAISHWSPDSKSQDVARRLAVHPDTLTKAVQRRFGVLSVADVVVGGKSHILDNLQTLLTTGRRKTNRR